jgi:hypothetical protein
MFRNKGLGHKWLKKKRVSLVEKNVWITERFFDNHYKNQQGGQKLLYNLIGMNNSDENSIKK